MLLYTYLNLPNLPFDRRKKCPVSLLSPSLLILLPSYLFVTQNLLPLKLNVCWDTKKNFKEIINTM